MKFWPIPNHIPNNLPESGEPGSFWEDRGDRHHAGIDVFAPAGLPVVAIEGGQVVEAQVFTSSERCPYWNTTYSIVVQNDEGQCLRYAEMGMIQVQEGQAVSAGQMLGTIGVVLDLDRINGSAPTYIQALKTSGKCSMLHFEVHRMLPEPSEDYLGGNYFIDQLPASLADPLPLLSEVLREWAHSHNTSST